MNGSWHLLDPRDRSRGWIARGDRVIFIDMSGDQPLIRSGHVTSHADERSHHRVDNARNVVIWFDEPQNLSADSADDAHERKFDIHDAHLWKIEEVDALRNWTNTLRIFIRLYQRDVVRSIMHSLNQVQLDAQLVLGL